MMNNGTWISGSCTINGVLSYNVKMEYPIFSGIKNKEVENTLKNNRNKLSKEIYIIK